METVDVIKSSQVDGTRGLILLPISHYYSNIYGANLIEITSIPSVLPLTVIPQYCSCLSQHTENVPVYPHLKIK